MDPAVVAAWVAAGASLLAATFTFIQARDSERRQQLRAALSELLVPLYSQLSAMNGLFRVFMADKPKEFRTLPFLLDRAGYTVDGRTMVLDASDERLLEEIIEMGRKIEDLIISKGGLADDPILNQNYLPDPGRTDIEPQAVKGLGLFALAIAHLRLLRLAHAQKLQGNKERYQNFVYPRELNDRVYEAIERTKRELQRSTPWT